MTRLQFLAILFPNLGYVCDQIYADILGLGINETISLFNDLEHMDWHTK